MSDFISRSALIARIKPPEEDDYNNKVFLGHVRKILVNFANSAPAVDAVEVVRCKDCIHYEFCKDGVVETDFCSSGERREDG